MKTSEGGVEQPPIEVEMFTQKSKHRKLGKFTDLAGMRQGIKTMPRYDRLRKDEQVAPKKASGKTQQVLDRTNIISV